MNQNKYILLLEDDSVDIMTIKRAMKQANFNNQLCVASNGEEGLSLLKNSSDLPGLIILDINMPKMNGLEFLRLIKENEYWKQIPVIMLTTSREQHDKVSAYNSGIAGYLIKPVDFVHFKEMINTIKDFFSITELPY